jgi:hypothetical protein
MDSLIKITDRTELIPPLDRFYVYSILITFREHCLKIYKDICPPDCEKEKIDERFGLSRIDNGRIQDSRDKILAHIGYETTLSRPLDCLVELLRNPRVLKRSLAHTWSAWQILHGEIYFDDLLVMHTIRVASPKLFETLVTNIREFRLFAVPNPKRDNKSLYNLINDKLRESSGVEKTLYHKLIQFLFPGWNIDPEKKNNMTGFDKPHLQGIAQNDPTDYLYRLTSESVAGEDQKTMKDILDYNEDSISKEQMLAKMRESHKYSERVEYFGRLLKPERVLDLTSAYFASITKYDYRRFADYELTRQLWNIHLKKSVSEEKHQNWLEQVLSHYLPISIRFAGDIFYFWKYRKDSEVDRKYSRPEILQIYHDLIKSQFDGKPEKFINSLEPVPEDIWTLRHLLFMNEDNKVILSSEKKNNFFAYWKPWFIDLLIGASKITPKLIAMNIVPLVYDIAKEHSDENEMKTQYGWRAQFDENIASLLFEDKLPIIMELISTLSENDYIKYDIGDPEKVILDYAIVHSKQWLLAKNNKCN